MHHRIFGPTGFRASEIGLGCWQLGGNDWGDVSDDQALEALSAAVDAGVNFFDTADVYGLGRSEQLVGRFLKQRSQDGRIYVATKLGRFPQPGGDANHSLAMFRAHTEASLKRLGVEALDLTQLHCIPTNVLMSGEPFEWLRTLKREGKIRDFGASVESMDEAMYCVAQEGVASLQIIFNVFRQKPIDALFEAARMKNVALIVRLPLASGLLGGKMSTQTTFPANDHRNYNRDGQAFNVGETFAGLPFEKGIEAVDAVRPVLPAGMDMARMALRWCLDFPAVSVVIPGAKRPEQARENARASTAPPLTRDVHERLRAVYLDKVRPHIRGPY
jgi:aryl-alcohol dehydrogenase-like predicted oxidoreductase